MLHRVIHRRAKRLSQPPVTLMAHHHRPRRQRKAGGIVGAAVVHHQQAAFVDPRERLRNTCEHLSDLFRLIITC